mgnify:CR=1 FL=1|jgi:hypothetical protein
MSDWTPIGGPYSDDRILCPVCEGTSECATCYETHDKRSGGGGRPHVDPDCETCSGSFECPNCDGIGLVDP